MFLEKPREIAPYNGFGSREDSLANCDSLMPKPPQKDFIKFMQKDRDGLNSHELRFIAKLVSGKILLELKMITRSLKIAIEYNIRGF